MKIMEIDGKKSIYPVKRYSVKYLLFRNLKIYTTGSNTSLRLSEKLLSSLPYLKNIFSIGTKTNRLIKDNKLWKNIFEGSLTTIL